MLKITKLFFLFVSVVFARHKAFTQFTLPPIDQHPFTGYAWRCQLLQDVGHCYVPGIYAVFSQNDVTLESTVFEPIFHRIVRNGQETIDLFHQQTNLVLPLVYVGRSINNLYQRIRSNQIRFDWDENDIVCYMRFPPNQGYLDSNDVTPVEQMLLQAFASTGNSFDNQGISYRDTVYFTPTQGSFDMLATLFNMDLGGISSGNFVYVQSLGHPQLPPQLPPQLQPHLKNSTSANNVSNRPSLKEIFNEGIPYNNGKVLDGEDWCSNTTKYKSTSPGYIDRISRLIAEYYTVSSIVKEDYPEQNGGDDGEDDISYGNGEKNIPEGDDNDEDIPDGADLPIPKKKGPNFTSSGNVEPAPLTASNSVGYGSTVNSSPAFSGGKTSTLGENGYQTTGEDGTSYVCPKCPKCLITCVKCKPCMSCPYICEPCLKGLCSQGGSCAPGGACYGGGSKNYVPLHIAPGGACASGGDCAPGGNCFRGDIHHPPGDCANGKINKTKVCPEIINCESAKNCHGKTNNICQELKSKLSGTRHFELKKDLKRTFSKYCKGDF
ncbi:hypothetical protein ACTA71_001237 [Dictyostelium dimigraforme]